MSFANPFKAYFCEQAKEGGEGEKHSFSII